MSWVHCINKTIITERNEDKTVMRKNNIFNTVFAQSASFARQAEEAIKSITSNPTLTLADEELKTLIMRSNSSFMTPIQHLFTHLVDSFKMRGNLPFIEVFYKLPNPPEIFTSDGVSFDTREVMKDLPERVNGPIVNLTNVVKLKASGGREEYVLGDIMKLHGLYVRSALCTSYLLSHDKLWLTPKICSFIIESYNMIISHQIRVIYHVTDILLMKKIGFIVSCFMAQRLEAEDKIGSVPDLIYRSGTWTSSEIQGMVGELNQHGFTFNKLYNIIDLCDMIKAIGGEKFHNFNLQQMSRLFTAGSIDKVFGSIAMEYPPYWVYQILLIASGTKHAVYNNIFKTGRMLDKFGSFANDINTCHNFIGSLV